MSKIDITDKYIEAFMEHITNGLTMKSTCAIIGVHTETVERWETTANNAIVEYVKQHTEDDVNLLTIHELVDEKVRMYVKFTTSLSRARGTLEQSYLDDIKRGGKAASGAQFLLERKFNADYGRQPNTLLTDTIPAFMAGMQALPGGSSMSLGFGLQVNKVDSGKQLTDTD